LLAGIGTRVGRAYVYSRDDVLAHIAPLAFLARYGLGLPRAHEVVKSHAEAIKAAVRDGQGRDLCVMLSLRRTIPGLDGAADSDGPEAYLQVNFSKIARFALARLQQCEQLERPRRRRRASLAPSVASEFVAR